MKLKEKIKSISTRFMSVGSRFLVPSLYIVAVSVIFIWCIITDDWDDTVTFILLSCAFGFLLSLLLSLIRNYTKVKIRDFINAPVSIALSVGCYFLLDTFMDNPYVPLAYIAVDIALFLLIIAVLYNDRHQDNLFGYLVSKAFFCILLCSVMFAGLSICILAFQFLIYEFKDIYKLYLILGVLSEFTIFAMMFLSYIPDEDEDLELSKTYSVIINKVALVIYFVLILILYIYLAKIVITRNMPNGRINWFASFALLFYILFYMSCQGQKSKLELILVRLGGVIMIPVMLMQGYAIYIRYAAYGLTSWRYLSMAFNVIGVIFIINSVFGYNVRYSILATAVICVLVLVGPLNALDVPFRNQRNLFYEVLERNDVQIANGIISVDKNHKFSEEDKDIIRSKYEYLNYSDSRLENIVKTNQDFEGTFGFPYYEYSDPDYKVIYVTYEKFEQSVDVTGYSSVATYSNYFYDEIDNKELEDFLWDLYHQYGQYGYSNQPMIFRLDENSDIYFTSINFDVYNDTQLKYVNIMGYILYK